jgi:hypothetical protein
MENTTARVELNHAVGQVIQFGGGHVIGGLEDLIDLLFVAL